MRTLLQIISFSMLVFTVAFPMLYLFDVMGESTMKGAILAVTVVWFVATPRALNN
ncbi:MULTISPECIES: hypothetical protein [unclassified Halomonas]|uniref:hypothetical protein n=1 Tax=unclassified Halomonas TaxID=2609666 RepID=UPI000B24EBAC|nr:MULTISPECIES: hypothetical protein [unclassified Halomonas]MBT2787178.1 hypothetical protein [Halomonas sp. ISL-106]MBT2795520.1 hypothetical protein [Halomonas sp. ISL-104]